MSCMKKPELIGPLLGYCNHRAYQRMEQKLRRYGVTPIQCRSLTYLHRQPGPVTQKQLQQHLAVKPSTVNGIVDRMVERGLVERSADASDARRRRVALTQGGMMQLERCRQELLDTERLVEKSLSPGELAQLHSLLDDQLHLVILRKSLKQIDL